VYSLGICFWEVTSRRVPYGEMNANTVALKVVTQGLRPKKPTEGCPDPFYELMQRCWRKDPEVRPTIDDILNHLRLLLVDEDRLEYDQVE